MTADTKVETAVPNPAERRSERRRNIDARVEATAQWILTLDAKVEKGLIKPQERADLIARSLVSRELLVDRSAEKKETANRRVLSAEEYARQQTEKATKDSLTGLDNRRSFDEQYAALLERGQPFGMLIADIDHFKGVNDKWGHPVGNSVLVQTARNLASGVRQVRLRGEENDTVFRYGGEEFVVILPNLYDPTILYTIAENLRHSVGSEPYVVEKDGFGVRIPITVSIGGGVYKPGIDGEQFFGAVDAALYTAKRKGRNRSNILLG